MSDKTKDSLRRKMADYEEVAPEGLFDDVMAEMDRRRKRKIISITAATLLAAAAIALLLINITTTQIDPTAPMPVESKVQMPEAPKPSEIIEQLISPTKSQVPSLLAKVTTQAEPERVESQEPETDTTTQGSLETTESQDSQTEDTQVQESQTQDTPRTETHPTQSYYYEPMGGGQQFTSKKRKRGVSLGMNINGNAIENINLDMASRKQMDGEPGSITPPYGNTGVIQGDGQGSGQGDSQLDPQGGGESDDPADWPTDDWATGDSGHPDNDSIPESSTRAARSRNEDRSQTEEVVEHVHHYQPVKVGLSVSFPLSTRWSLETGVFYSHQTSDIEYSNRTVKQHLNYVGVPLNLLYRLWNNRRWNIYGAAGTSVEKMVGGTQKDASGSKDVSIKALQWSLNAHGGAEYRFSPTFGIYVEPGLDYYFDNHPSFPTFYSDHPWHFELKLGVRFSPF